MNITKESNELENDSTGDPQLRLFEIENPLKMRLGADFFRRLPKQPGVYWMLDGRGRLLYVGKSGNLRQRLTSYRSLKPERLPARLSRLLLGTEHIGFERTESEPRALAMESQLLKILKPPCNRAGVRPEKSFDWLLRETPRSWRLEIRTFDGAESKSGFKSPPRFFKVHGAILRQLHGLVRGHFAIQDLPTALLRGPSGLAGAFPDRALNSAISGATAEEKRIFNEGLRETVQRFLEGLEPWPEFPCPADHARAQDRWSVELWSKDQEDLKQAFENYIRPVREKQYGLGNSE